MTRSQRYYLRHKDRVRAANRKWAAANPEAAKAISRRHDKSRAAVKAAYKAAHAEHWQPGGRYYRVLPHALREAIRLNNDLKRAL